MKYLICSKHKVHIENGKCPVNGRCTTFKVATENEYKMYNIEDYTKRKLRIKKFKDKVYKVKKK